MSSEVHTNPDEINVQEEIAKLRAQGMKVSERVVPLISEANNFEVERAGELNIIRLIEVPSATTYESGGWPGRPVLALGPGALKALAKKLTELVPE